MILRQLCADCWIDLNVASAGVIGISDGGCAAMRFLELYPEHVDRLLMVSLVSLGS